MAHYCKICGRHRPNEKFSGKGHRNSICKECAKKPKAEISATVQKDEILGLLEQSNISQKNIERLAILSRSSNSEVATIASLVIEVAEVKPHKKRRSGFLAKEHKELFFRLDEAGLIFHDYD